MADNEQYLQAIARIIARCWADPAFQQQFISSPNDVLAAEGLTVPAGVTITVLADTQKNRHIVIPLASGLTVEQVQNNLQQYGFAAFCATFCS